MIGRRVVDRKSVNALVAFTKKRAVTVRKAVDDFVRRGFKKDSDRRGSTLDLSHMERYTMKSWQPNVIAGR